MQVFLRTVRRAIHGTMAKRRIHAGPGLDHARRGVAPAADGEPGARDARAGGAGQGEAGQGATGRGATGDADGRRPGAGPPPTADLPAIRRTLLKRVRRAIHQKGYSPRTEEMYLSWGRRFLGHHPDRAPAALGVEDVNRFLRHLGEERSLSPKTVNQAASALAFLFRSGLGVEIGGWSKHLVRPKAGTRRPSVLTRTEVRLLLDELEGLPHLVASLLYGSGLRINECLTLRMKDVCLEERTLMVRDGKGRKDRTAILARQAIPALRAQMDAVREQHREDREAGAGWAALPTALHRSKPREGWTLAWQHVFPSPKLSVDPKTKHRGRRPRHPNTFQKAVKLAGRRTGIPKIITCHTLRHSFATHALRAGMDPRTVQTLMGHKSLRTTMIYLHPEMAGARVISPLDLNSDY